MRERIARQQARTAEKAEVKVLAAQARETIMLDLIMPNGKQMRYCTGQEMSGFSAAYQAIATMVGPNCLVGEILVEAQICELLCSA